MPALPRHIPNLESLKLPEALLTAIRRLYQLIYDLRDKVLEVEEDVQAGGTGVAVEVNNTSVGTRTLLDFIQGTGLTITGVDDSVNERIKITFTVTCCGSSGAGGSGGSAGGGGGTVITYNAGTSWVLVTGGGASLGY